MKRLLLRILICLLLGVVTTVGVAWGLAVYWGPMDYVPDMRIGYVHRDNVTWDVWCRDVTGGLYLEVSPELDPPEQVPSMEVPRWSMSSTSLPNATLPDQYWQEQAFGWPALALFGRLGDENPAQMIEIDSWDDLIPLDEYGTALPLHPIWPGFISNSLMYGILWFVPLFGLTATRRTIRRRRGRCPKCGYDLRGHADHRQDACVTGCPECGWGRAEGIKAPGHQGTEGGPQ